MKNTKTFLLVLLFAAALFLAFGVAHAQTSGFSLDWWTVDGGGGTSTGGAYALSSSTGQPDAGVLSGDGYQLSGGFWAGGPESIPGSNKLFLPLVIR